MVNITKTILGLTQRNTVSEQRQLTRQFEENRHTIYIRTTGFSAPYYIFYDKNQNEIEGGLRLNGGTLYNFVALESLSSHPFFINDAKNTLTTKDSTLTISVPIDKEELTYGCTLHASMRGTISLHQKTLRNSDYIFLGRYTVIQTKLEYKVYKTVSQFLFGQHYDYVASTNDTNGIGYNSISWGIGITGVNYEEQKKIVEDRYKRLKSEISTDTLKEVRGAYYQNGFDSGTTFTDKKNVSYATINQEQTLIFTENTTDTFGSYLLVEQIPFEVKYGIIKQSKTNGEYFIEDTKSNDKYYLDAWPELYESYKKSGTLISGELFYKVDSQSGRMNVAINKLDKRKQELYELADFIVGPISSYNSEKNIVSIDLTNNGPVASTGYLDTNTDYHSIICVTKNIEESKDVGTLKAKTPIYMTSSDIYYPESIVGLPSVGSAIENLTSSNEKYSVSMEHINEFGLLITTTPLHESNDTITISFKIATDNNTFIPGKTYMFCADIPIADDENIGDTKEQVDTLNNPSNNNFVWTIPEPEPDSEYIEVQILGESLQSDSIEGQFYNFFQYPVEPSTNYHPLAIITNSNAEETIDLVLRKIDIATYDDDKYRPMELLNADGVVVQTLYASNNTMEYTLSVPPGKNTLRVHTDKVIWETTYKIYQVPPIINCLKTTSKMNIINNNGTNFYVLNNLSNYDSSIKYGVYNGTYTITNIPESHALAILNKNMESNISYSGDETKKITQKVNDDEYDFYHGSLEIKVKGNFNKASLYCVYHGYMGGEDILHYTANCNIPKEFVRGVYEDFLIEVQALKDFINFEAKRADGSLIQRNVLNLDLFTDNGKSNPTYSVFVFQRELNIALKNQNIDSPIGEDGFFGVNTAKALQKLINSYIEDHAHKVPLDGKIVSSILTSRALGKTIDAMITNNEPFVLELLRFIDNHGTIQQQGRLPIATNTVIVPFIDV